MGLKLRDIMSRQPIYIINKANDVEVSKLVRTKSKKAGLPAVTAHVIDPSSRNNGHNCQIVVVDTPRISAPNLITGNVKVSCDCEWFMYYCEYALSKWGAANIKFSNGEPAYTTNPGNVALICKHLYALGSLL